MARHRLLLRGRIDNIQTSWVKLGVLGTRAMLRAGANDLGGTLMEETISRMAGSEHGSATPSTARSTRRARHPGRSPFGSTNASVPVKRMLGRLAGRNPISATVNLLARPTPSVHGRAR